MAELRRLTQQDRVRHARSIGRARVRRQAGRRADRRRSRRSRERGYAENRSKRVHDARNGDGAALELLRGGADVGEPERDHLDLEGLQLLERLLGELGSLELELARFVGAKPLALLLVRGLQGLDQIGDFLDVACVSGNRNRAGARIVSHTARGNAEAVHGAREFVVGHLIEGNKSRRPGAGGFGRDGRDGHRVARRIVRVSKTVLVDQLLECGGDGNLVHPEGNRALNIGAENGGNAIGLEQAAQNILDVFVR